MVKNLTNARFGTAIAASLESLFRYLKSKQRKTNQNEMGSSRKQGTWDFGFDYTGPIPLVLDIPSSTEMSKYTLLLMGLMWGTILLAWIGVVYDWLSKVRVLQGL